MITPVAMVYLAYFFVKFDLEIMQGLVLSLSALFAAEIRSKMLSEKFIWEYIRDSVRNKFAFFCSLVVTVILIWIPAQTGIRMQIYHRILFLLLALFLGQMIFILLVTSDLRKKYVKGLRFWSNSGKIMS